MTTSTISKTDALADIGAALRKSLAVPTDTMITDDMPLLLTRLSGVPYALTPSAVPDRNHPSERPKS